MFKPQYYIIFTVVSEGIFKIVLAFLEITLNISKHLYTVG